MNVKLEITQPIETALTKSERTRLTILSAAARQFRIAGYEPSTLRKIADAAGIEAGSIYYHFASKEEIFDVVLDMGLRYVYDAVKKVSEDCQKDDIGFRETLARMVHAHIEHLLKENDFTSSNIRNFSMLSEEVRERHRPLRLAYSHLWDDFLKKALENGKIRSDIKIVPLRQFLLGALNWMGEWFNASRIPVSVLSESAVRLILDGMLIEPRKSYFTVENTNFIEADFIEQGDSKAARTRMFAAKVMRASGYRAATLRQIAAAAKMEAGSIYYHFNSKEDLLDELLDRGLREMADGVSKILRDFEKYPDPSQQLADAIDAHMKVLFARSEFTSANIRMYGQLPQEVRARHRPVRRKYASAWDACLKNAQEEKIVRSDFEVIPLRLFLLGALNWTVEWFDPGKGGREGFYSLQEMIAMQQTLLLSGIARN